MLSKEHRVQKPIAYHPLRSRSEKKNMPPLTIKLKCGASRG